MREAAIQPCKADKCQQWSEANLHTVPEERPPAPKEQIRPRRKYKQSGI